MAFRNPMPKRPATPEEHKALAHPLRMRILRLCFYESRTNKELADRLGKDPATVLHHVRTLVDTGFLEPDGVRTGARGALEKPYRATGKSWFMSIEHLPASERFADELAMLDALRDEIIEAGPDCIEEMNRLGLRMNRASMEDLRARLWEVVKDFAERPEDEDGEVYGLFVTIHRQA